MGIGFLRAAHIAVHSPNEFPSNRLRVGVKGRKRAHREARINGTALQNGRPFWPGDIPLDRAEHPEQSRQPMHEAAFLGHQEVPLTGEISALVSMHSPEANQ